MRAHANSPKDHTEQHNRSVSQKQEWRGQSRKKEPNQQNPKPKCVEQFSERKPTERAHRHGDGVVDRDEIRGDYSRFLKMVRDEREVGEARCERSGRDHVKPVRAGKMFGLDFLGHFQFVRLRKKIAGHKNDQNGQHSWNEQEGEGVSIISMFEQGQRDDERSNCGAGLIERFVQTKDPAASDLFSSE